MEDLPWTSNFSLSCQPSSTINGSRQKKCSCPKKFFFISNMTKDTFPQTFTKTKQKELYFLNLLLFCLCLCLFDTFPYGSVDFLLFLSFVLPCSYATSKTRGLTKEYHQHSIVLCIANVPLGPVVSVMYISNI